MDIRRDNESVAEKGAGLNTVDVFKMALPQDKVSTITEKDLPSSGSIDFAPDNNASKEFAPGGCVIRPDQNSKHDKSGSEILDGAVKFPNSPKPESKTIPELGGNTILKAPLELKPDSTKDRGSDVELLPKDLRGEKWNPKKVSTDAAISLGAALCAGGTAGIGYRVGVQAALGAAVGAAAGSQMERASELGKAAAAGAFEAVAGGAARLGREILNGKPSDVKGRDAVKTVGEAAAALSGGVIGGAVVGGAFGAMNKLWRDK